MTKYLKEETKKLIYRVVLSGKDKREAALRRLGLSEGEYKKQMTKLRKKPFVDFEASLDELKENLSKNGFVVHEAAQQSDVERVMREVLQGSQVVARSKSNTAKEIGIERILEGIESFETDLGDFIVQLFSEEDQHYVLPAIHLEAEKIAEKIREVFGDEVLADPEKLTHYLCGRIRQNILRADTGITGANFVTKTGQVVLLENEGNISLVSRLPQKHIVVVGIDKVVETVEDATQLCRAAAIFGTGQDITQYISVIAGPSKTADIENVLVHGAQGAKEVHVVLVDNGRRQMMEKGFGDILHCINCGSCLNFCPAYHQKGNEYGGKKYIVAKGIIKTALTESLQAAKDKGSFQCTLCGSCTENCPMQIPLSSMIRNVRKLQDEKGLQTEQNNAMFAAIEKHGNPFGEVSDDEVPDKLYCC